MNTPQNLLISAFLSLIALTGTISNAHEWDISVSVEVPDSDSDQANTYTTTATRYLADVEYNEESPYDETYFTQRIGYVSTEYSIFRDSRHSSSSFITTRTKMENDRFSIAARIANQNSPHVYLLAISKDKFDGKSTFTPTNPLNESSRYEYNSERTYIHGGYEFYLFDNWTIGATGYFNEYKNHTTEFDTDSLDNTSKYITQDTAKSSGINLSTNNLWQVSSSQWIKFNGSINYETTDYESSMSWRYPQGGLTSDLWSFKVASTYYFTRKTDLHLSFTTRSGSNFDTAALAFSHYFTDNFYARVKTTRDFNSYFDSDTYEAVAGIKF